MQPAPTRVQRVVWFTRAPSLVASLVPVLVAIAPLVRVVDWGRAALTLLATAAFQAGTNVVNDLGDARRGVDRPGSRPPNPIVAGALPAARARLLAVLCFAAGVAIGLTLCALAGWGLLWLGIVGLVGGVAYTAGPAYKYAALGDVGVLLLMGPFVTLGATYVQLERFTWAGFWIGAGPGLLAAAILVANNVRDIERDTEAGVRTTATLLGRAVGGRYFTGLVLGAYAAVVALAASRQVSWWALTVFGSAPAALGVLRRAAKATDPKGWARVLGRTVRLHVGYGLTLTAGLVIGAIANT